MLQDGRPVPIIDEYLRGASLDASGRARLSAPLTGPATVLLQTIGDLGWIRCELDLREEMPPLEIDLELAVIEGTSGLPPQTWISYVYESDGVTVDCSFKIDDQGRFRETVPVGIGTFKTLNGKVIGEPIEVTAEGLSDLKIE